MYPKLKVRSQERGNPSLPGLKALDSLVHGNYSTPAIKESKKTTTKKIEAEESSASPLSASKDKNDRGEEDIRTHIRASPIPRPRAVLSSPVNDAMIGTKTNRRTEERKSDQKSKVTTTPSTTRLPRSGNEVSKEATKSRQSSTKVTNCNVTIKNSAAERHRNGRMAPNDTLNKSVTAACKGSVPIAIKIKD